MAEMRERLARLADTDLAYTAGLLDGEACITLEPPGIAANGRRKAGRVRIIVYMITPDVLRWLRDSYGGYFRERGSRQPGQRPIYHWGLDGKSAGLLLTHLLPYMRVKDKQAEVAIAFYETQLARPSEWYLNPSYVAALKRLKAEMLVLNRRGVA